MTEKKKRGPGRPPGSKNKKNITPDVSAKRAGESGSSTRGFFATEPRVRDEIGAIVLIAFGVFLIIALQTKLVGLVGNGISDFLKGAFGLGGFFLPYFLIIYAILIFAGAVVPFSLRTAVIQVLLYLTLDLINAGRYVADMKYGILGIKEVYNAGIDLKNGGVFGMYAGNGIYNLIGIVGLYLLCGVLILIFALLLVNTPISRFFQKAKERRELRAHERQTSMTEDEKRKADREKRWAEAALEKSRKLDEINDIPPFEMASDKQEIQSRQEEIPLYREESKNISTNPGTDVSHRQRNILDLVLDDSLFDKDEADKQPVSKPSFGFDNQIDVKDKTATQTGLVNKESDNMPFVFPKTPGKYVLPPLDLLKKAAISSSMKGMNHGLNERAALLEHTLRSFNVEAKVTNVVEGPSVTRYEIQPAVGVKVSSIVRLSDDIALNLRAKSIRLEAPIPGKAAVGIEVENEHREMVSIREIIESKEFQTHKSKLAFAVGKDIGGNAVVADLAKMPHLLIAGATGSGKSVCINTIISSFLCKARPEEVKLVLIDPKMVELGNYNGIPHLLIPVVTDSTKAAAALNWAVAEMSGRYKKFAAVGARDIATYNNIMDMQRQMIEPDEMERFKPPHSVREVDPTAIAEEIFRKIQEAKRPVLLLGNGISKRKETRDLLKTIIERLNIPVITSILGRDIMTYDNPLNFGFLGAAYGHRYANLIVNKKADLVVSLGMSMCKRQVGMKPNQFAAEAEILRVDIDPIELKRKVHEHEISFLADCNIVIGKLADVVPEQKNIKSIEWIEVCREIRERLEAFDRSCSERKPNDIVETISDHTADFKAICSDVGQHQMWCAQSYKLAEDQRLLFSGGHGAMMKELGLKEGDGIQIKDFEFEYYDEY